MLKVVVAVDWARANFNTGQPQWEESVSLEGGLGIQCAEAASPVSPITTIRERCTGRRALAWRSSPEGQPLNVFRFGQKKFCVVSSSRDTLDHLLFTIHLTVNGDLPLHLFSEDL